MLTKLPRYEKSIAKNPWTNGMFLLIPFEQFTSWWNEAIAGKLPEPNAMVIATADKDGRPSVRMVLLKQFDERGFCFYTNYQSQKGEELAHNNHAALLFFWVEFERQIRIEGTVEKLSRAENERYFDSRPRGAQLSAKFSDQSDVVASREMLQRKIQDFEAKHPGEKITCPDHWGGYRVIPEHFEFWQGRSDRLHDRIAYQLGENGWVRSRLCP